VTLDMRHLHVMLMECRMAPTWWIRVEIGWRRFGLFALRLQDSLAGILGVDARCARFEGTVRFSRGWGMLLGLLGIFWPALVA
jgi:hypothetical protein